MMTMSIHSVRFTLALLAFGLCPVAGAAQSRLGDPVLVQSTRVDVVIGAPALRDGAADRVRIAKLVAGCRRSMRISEADSAAVVATTPPEFESDIANGGSSVVFSVLHSEGLAANCGDRPLQSTVLASAGLRITFDTAYVPDRDIVRVVLKRGDGEIIPLATQRELVRRLGPGGFEAPRIGWVRFAVDLARLAPDADGRIDDLVLEVYFAAGSAPDRFPIPWVAVRSAWESLLESRVSSGATGRAPMTLPEPGDEALHLAFEAYQRDDLTTAARLGARRVSSPQLGSADRLQGRMQLGLAFAGLGDTAAARVVLGRAIEEEPCLALDASAPERARALLDGLRRPPARCTAQSLAGTLVRSALLPGLGRPTTQGDKPVRVGIAVLTATLAAGAVYSASQANSEYDKYLAYQVRPDFQVVGGSATVLFRSAESARVRGRTLWMLTGLLWGGQLATTVWAEDRHARRLDWVRHYGAAPRARDVSVVPMIGPKDLGLSLSLRW